MDTDFEAQYDDLVTAYDELSQEVGEKDDEIQGLLDEIALLMEQADEAQAAAEAAEQAGDLAASKAASDCWSDTWNAIAGALTILSGLLAGAAVAAGETVVGLPAVPYLLGAAALAVVLSGIAWELSIYYGELAEDPPQRNFRKRARLARPLAPIRTTLTRDSGGLLALPSLARHSQRLIQYSHAALDSMERYQGARIAKNTRYARSQSKSMSLLMRQSVTHVERARKSILDMAIALEKSGPNVKITAKDLKAFQATVKKSGLPAVLSNALREQAGFTAAQVQDYVKWMLALSPSIIKKDAKLSWHLRQCYFKFAPGIRHLGLQPAMVKAKV